MHLKNMVIAGALAILVGSPVSAMPVAGLGPAIENAGAVTPVAQRRPPPRPPHRPPHGRPPQGGWGGVRPGVGVGIYVEPDFLDREPQIRGRRAAHNRWCLARYQSFNPASNRYLGYDGTFRACRSPYR